ncbi:receptor-like protein 12, partial [Prunus avium]|uniref:Receptor-like protein 12 n=1 Tax=Prunus avium TaxID=42229 RepID=A0A6P5RKC0_PRUAV
SLPSLEQLSLVSNQLSGNIIEFQSRSLSSLLLSDNNLHGLIPRSIFELENLRYLGLSSNNLSGTVEFEKFSKLQSLSSLELSYNHLSLSFNHLSNNSWPQLLDLVLSSCNISEFPYFLRASPNLESLHLGSNKLHGLIPRSIFELENLQSLGLSSNNLSGTVEFEKFSKLQSLSDLELSGSHLSLSFNHLSNNSWPQLYSLDLSSCNISEFPYFLRASPNLDTLNLSYNQIQGEVPKWFWDVAKDSLSYLDLSHNFLKGTARHLQWKNLTLYYLDLSHNFLKGTARHLRWKNLGYLNLHNNSLQGELPIPSPSTFFFSISNNQLTGEMPPTICSLTSLQILDLSNNKLGGEIHQCIGNFSQSLSVLDLRNNNFHGVIPGTFSNGNVLRNLDLNGNQLEGSLPRTLLTCRELEVLDLGNNKIQGTFPNWLESLPKLQVLILRSNKFYGEIGKLRIVDLSYNQFSGLLPTKYFEHLTAMINSQEHELKYMGEYYYEDSVVVTIKGFEIEMVKIQTFFTTIDFSSNTFREEISNVIGKLKSLKGLNFSHNELT